MKPTGKLISACALLLIIVLSACTPTRVPEEISTNTPAPEATATQTSAPTSTETPTPTLTPTDEPTLEPSATLPPTPAVYDAGSMPANINPLTGLRVSDPSFLERRPVSFKINMYPRDYYRPVIGLDAADLVFDYYHNDGYTRLHAIYYGNTAEEVGPIRSGRHLDAKLMRMYKTILAFGNADELILQQLTAADLYQRLLYATGYPCPAVKDHPLCREDPEGFDYLVGDIELIHDHVAGKGVDDTKQDLAGLSFAAEAPEDGEAVKQIYTFYSMDDYNRWDYDPKTNRYLRFQDAVYANGIPEAYIPLIDRVNNKQISAANVVVLFVRHDEIQPEPNDIYDVLLNGSGKAVVFRDGQMYEVTWFVPTPTSALSLQNADGTAFYLAPGNTWFQVIGPNSQDNEPAPGVMRFTFSLY